MQAFFKSDKFLKAYAMSTLAHTITKSNTSVPISEDYRSDVRQRNASGESNDERSTSVSDEQKQKELLQEKALLRKLDWRIVPWIFILYFLSVEDRANVGYAMTMNKQQGHDLASTAGLTAKENNIGLGLFYVAYIVSGLNERYACCVFIYILWFDRCLRSLRIWLWHASIRRFGLPAS